MSCAKFFLHPVLLFAILTGCSADELINPNQPIAGEFSLLTYNVAGLPQGISASNPERNMPLISPLLNKFEVALVQEDFYYHRELSSSTNHPFKSDPSAPPDEFTAGDGLNRFSVLPFKLLHRERWEACSNESAGDCLASKGFTVAETELAPGLKVDIYNLHMDAGGQPGDAAARAAQTTQLLQMINSRSAGKAVIVAGDANLHIASRSEDMQIFQSLLEGARLIDSCRSLQCGMELVDRVLIRSGGGITLQAISWGTDQTFVDPDGNALSDHEALVVRIRWALNTK